MKAGAGGQVSVAEHRKCQRQRGITKPWGNGGEGAVVALGKKKGRAEEVRPCDSRSRVTPVPGEIQFPRGTRTFKVIEHGEYVLRSRVFRRI